MSHQMCDPTALLSTKWSLYYMWYEDI